MGSDRRVVHNQEQGISANLESEVGRRQVHSFRPLAWGGGRRGSHLNPLYRWGRRGKLCTYLTSYFRFEIHGNFLLSEKTPNSWTCGYFWNLFGPMMSISRYDFYVERVPKGGLGVNNQKDIPFTSWRQLQDVKTAAELRVNVSCGLTEECQRYSRSFVRQDVVWRTSTLHRPFRWVKKKKSRSAQEWPIVLAMFNVIVKTWKS